MYYPNHRDDIVEVGKRMYAKDFVASNDGNISIRISENEIMITPSGVSKGYMKADELAIVDLEGNIISGDKKPSSEMKMHLAIYKVRDDVKAIVHAHPQKATAFAVARIPIDKVALPEVVLSLGIVSLAGYGTPTTFDLPKNVVEKICGSDAVLLENHGALTVGADVMDAYYKMETLEHFCSIILYARQLGGETFLDDAETEKLFSIRKDLFGKELPTCNNCGYCDAIDGKSCSNNNTSDSGIFSDTDDSILKKRIEEATRQILIEMENR